MEIVAHSDQSATMRAREKKTTLGYGLSDASHLDREFPAQGTIFKQKARGVRIITCRACLVLAKMVSLL